MKNSSRAPQNWLYLAQLSVNYLGWVFCWNVATTYMSPNILLGLVDDSVKNTRLGLMSGAGNIMVIILIPLIGALSDRTTSEMGRRRPYYIAAASMMAVFIMLMVYSGNYLFLLALIVLMHAAAALWFPNRALVRDIVPIERRGRVSGLIQIANLIGMMSAHVLAPRLVEAGRLLLLAIIAGAVNVVSNLWVALAIREPAPAFRSARPADSWKEIYFPKLESGDGLKRLAAFNLLTQMGMVAMVCFLLYFIKDQVDPVHFNKTFGTVVLIAMTAAIPSSFGSGVIADRLGRKRVLLIGCLLQLACILNFLISPRLHSTLYISGLLYGLGNGAYLSMYWTLVSDLVPEADAGKYMGLMQYTFLIPWAIVPPALGPMVDRFGASSGPGYNILFVVIVFLLAGGLIMIRKIPETFKTAPAPVADFS
ncbi:MAG: MFS transporter [Candidatus Abyssobacteria bacterium SURF_5]|uniref:MFS transporter n=1 Tax=Abyssobacteria bacterium (strain SURF_5) TaxID=2093360 RepID=A0A3A4P1J2_ABYX5|nr:MAG: MFS transporter [Candidatus Abyssubacteria bacterium SURF_5]